MNSASLGSRPLSSRAAMGKAPIPFPRGSLTPSTPETGEHAKSRRFSSVGK